MKLRSGKVVPLASMYAKTLTKFVHIMAVTTKKTSFLHLFVTLLWGNWTCYPNPYRTRETERKD